MLMRSGQTADRLISEHWSKLRRGLTNERDPETLLALFERLDDVLFDFEMKMASQNDLAGTRQTRLDRRASAVAPSDDSATGE